MNTKQYLFAFTAALFILLPFTALHAATFLPVSEETASLRSPVDGDVYAASNSVVIAAPVAGDIFAAGDTVDISGSSGASIFAIGRNLVVTGEAKDDVRVAGSFISLGSVIAHDLFAAGSSIVITKDSHVRGDAYVAGETVAISGKIDGNLRSAANSVVIHSGAVVTGDITSYGNAPIIQEGATVSGKITTIERTQAPGRAANAFTLTAFIASVVSSAIFALLLLTGAPVLVAKTKVLITKSPIHSGLTGFVWLIFVIPVSILLLISSVGVYVGIFLLLITAPLCLLAFGVMVVSAGSIIYPLIAKNEGTYWHHGIVGALIVSVIGLLGVIGFIVLLFAFFVAFGALLKALWNIIQGS